MRKTIIALLILLLAASQPVSAVSDYDLYAKVMEQQGEGWNSYENQRTLWYLLKNYTAHGTLEELTAKMDWLHSHELRREPAFPEEIEPAIIQEYITNP